jgi:hypothetical protein
VIQKGFSGDLGQAVHRRGKFVDGGGAICRRFFAKAGCRKAKTNLPEWEIRNEKDSQKGQIHHLSSI